MTILILVLFLITIVISIFIYLYNTYNKLNIINIKMRSANEGIEKALNKKLDLMKNLYAIIKKKVEKKDYLKSFSNLKNKNLSTNELDIELTNYLNLMKQLVEDYSKLQTKEVKKLFNDLKIVDQELTANKVFFNKNNNILIKDLKGFNKLLGKMFHINVLNSYEIKPIDEENG